MQMHTNHLIECPSFSLIQTPPKPFIAFVSLLCLFAPEMVQPTYVSLAIIISILIQYWKVFVLFHCLFAATKSIHTNLVVQSSRPKMIGKQKCECQRISFSWFGKNKQRLY